MRIRLAQCVCGPRRHALLALAADPALGDVDVILYLKLAVAETIAGRGEELGLPFPRMNPVCGICNAPEAEWQYEVGWTVDYPDWDAALKALRRSEAMNLLSRAMIDSEKEKANWN